MRKHWLGRTKRILKVGADRAEQFDVVESQQIEPGDVLVIHQGGTLQCSNKAYDKTVTGVVSAAGMHRTGIVLDQRAAQEPASNGIDRESVLQSGCPVCINRRWRSANYLFNFRSCDEGKRSAAGLWSGNWEVSMPAQGW
jgi:hypothetical protein